MPRRLLNLATVLSMLLCVAACAAAVVARRGGFCVGWERRSTWLAPGAEGSDGRSYSIQGIADRLMLVSTVSATSYPNDRENPTVITTSSSHFFCTSRETQQGMAPTADPTTYPTRLGFARMNENVWPSSHSGAHFDALIFPPWLPMAVTGVLPGVIAVRNLRRQVAVPHGPCLACGYNLTGNVSGVCPECGCGKLQ